MPLRMKRSSLAAFLNGVGLGLAVAWVLETVLVGRGVVSIYLAPGAVVAPLVALFIRRR